MSIVLVEMCEHDDYDVEEAVVTSDRPNKVIGPFDTEEQALEYERGLYKDPYTTYEPVEMIPPQKEC